jgi:predicted nucleotidyltransferase
MTRALIEDFEALTERLRPHVRGARRAIVFGSVARGEADAGSDLDLVIIADTPRPFFERFKDFAGVWEVWPRLDMLIYTPAEFEQMRAEGNPFIERVLAEGRVVHEAAQG